MKNLILTLIILFSLFVSGCNKSNDNSLSKKGEVGNVENSQIIGAVFNSCNNIENFQEEEWFKSFLNKILNENDLDTDYANYKYTNRKIDIENEKKKMEKIQKQQIEEQPNQSTPYISDMKTEEVKNKLEQLSLEDIIQEFGKIKKDSIRELCFLKNKDFVIAIAGGEYCNMGNIFRYDILKNELKRAKFKSNRENCDVTFSNFEKVDGDIIQLIGKFGDAGMSRTDFFDYNFVNNTIYRKKSCSKSVQNPEEKCINKE